MGQGLVRRLGNWMNFWGDNIFDVIIPVFKTNPLFLREAISSVLDQTFQEFEIYISDGTPIDHPYHSKNTLEDINDSRIHILQQVGKGISDARNQSLRAGNNPYVCTLDSDDVWDIRKLEYTKLIIESENKPVKMMWGAAAHGLGLDNIEYRAGYFEEWEKTKPEHRWLRLYWSPLMTSTIVYERKSLVDFGGWNPYMTLGEDMEVNWKFMWYYPVQCIQASVYLGKYRSHDNSTVGGGESGHTNFNSSIIPNSRRFSADKMLESMKQNSKNNLTPHWKHYWAWYENVLHKCRQSCNQEYIDGERTHPLHILQRLDGVDNGSKFVERPKPLTEEYILNLRKQLPSRTL